MAYECFADASLKVAFQCMSHCHFYGQHIATKQDSGRKILQQVKTALNLKVFFASNIQH